MLARADGGEGEAASISERGFSAAVCEGCMELGARLIECPVAVADAPEAQETAVDDAVERIMGELGGVEMLVVDGAELFERQGLMNAMQASWSVTRAVANRAFIEPGAPGRIVYLAPVSPREAAYSGELPLHAEATRAGLENLARTLSIEWARHSITTVTIAPGVDTTAGEVAALAAYLASPAGAYFSGCLLDLRGPAGH